MLWGNKNRGAINAPKSFADKNKTERNYSHALQSLQGLRDISLHYAMKYRFDPVLSRAHKEYLTLLNGIILECEAWI